MSEGLRRLIVEFKPDGIQLRTLYRTTDGPGPSTKKRRLEVEQLVRTGLERTLEALDVGEVEDLGTSGFTTREDVLGLNPLQQEATPEREASPFRCQLANLRKPQIEPYKTLHRSP